jgi:hypothetical protein
MQPFRQSLFIDIAIRPRVITASFNARIHGEASVSIQQEYYGYPPYFRLQNHFVTLIPAEWEQKREFEGFPSFKDATAFASFEAPVARLVVDSFVTVIDDFCLTKPLVGTPRLWIFSFSVISLCFQSHTFVDNIEFG